MGAEHFDYKFYTGKVETARFYLRNVVPNVCTAADIISDGDTSALNIALEAFEY
ncbi:MAG: acyl-CoA dehydrogenase C-terminal domain-containing protein [Syntrophomonadaceae bacterium]|nr:acyl-CoA dehydrogenase C-terminal domain-containing protein [Syntrophomonadaceae bacterium]